MTHEFTEERWLRKSLRAFRAYYCISLSNCMCFPESIPSSNALPCWFWAQPADFLIFPSRTTKTWLKQNLEKVFLTFYFPYLLLCYEPVLVWRVTWETQWKKPAWNQGPPRSANPEQTTIWPQWPESPSKSTKPGTDQQTHSVHPWTLCHYVLGRSIISLNSW